MPEMSFDFGCLIRILGRTLHHDRLFFICELVQNSYDSILRYRAVTGDRGLGEISLECRPESLSLSIADDGDGMDRDDLERRLSIFGASGRSAENMEVDGIIGRSGIGFMSALAVARLVEVRTRKLGQTQGWLWTSNGTSHYEVSPVDMVHTGTIVTVHLAGDDLQNEIEPDRVVGLIRRYVDMLDVPIFVNGTGPANRMRVPWQSGIGGRGFDGVCRRWIEDTFGEVPLELIGIAAESPCRIDGILYVRPPNGGQRRRLRVYCNRVLINEDGEGLLPDWAFFIGGAIEAPELVPTAGRNGFLADDTAAAIRQFLGRIVLDHLNGLRETAPERLAEIARQHDNGFKRACRSDDSFFAAAKGLLHWRCNGGAGRSVRWMPFAEVIETLRNHNSDDNPVAVPCVTHNGIVDQYFALADATGTVVVDARHRDDVSQLVRCATESEGCLLLTHIDQEDDPAIFRRLSEAEQPQFRDVAAAIAYYVQNYVAAKVVIDVRSFLPVDIPAMCRPGARSAYDGHSESAALQGGARTLLRGDADSPVSILVNAANPLIRRLSTSDFTDPDVGRIVAALFTAVVLASADTVSPDAFRDWQRQFEGLLHRFLDLILTGSRSRVS